MNSLKRSATTLIVVAWSFVGHTSITSAAEPISREEFTQRMLAALNAIQPTLHARLNGPLEISAIARDGGKWQFNLSNIYKEHKAAPDEIDSQVKHYATAYVETTLSSFKNFDIGKILPLIKRKAFVVNLDKQSNGSTSSDTIFEPLNSEIGVTYVFDAPNYACFLTKPALQTLKIARENLRRIAITNLTGRGANMVKKEEPGFVGMVSDDIYLASLILFDGWWTPDKMPFKGKLAVYIPARNALIATGTGEVEGLREAREEAERLYDELPYPISKKMFIREGSNWIVAK